jgi:hypothetical protein
MGGSLLEAQARTREAGDGVRSASIGRERDLARHPRRLDLRGHCAIPAQEEKPPVLRVDGRRQQEPPVEVE